MSLLADVKKRLRALLISSKSGCSPKQLYQDYREVVGEDIPYTELGYRSLMSFIKSIPDVVSVKLTRDGHTTLYAVGSAETQHIMKMVSRQKTSRSAGNLAVQPPKRRPPPKKIPDTFGIQLKQLFLSYPNGVSLDRFNEAFARRFGYYLKYQSWGYATLDEVLEDAKEVKVHRDPLRGSAVVKLRRKSQTLQLDKTVSSQLPQDSLHALETSPDKERSFSMPQRASECADRAEDKADDKPTRPPIPDKLIKNIIELLVANPAGVWLSQFSSHYKDYFGEDLPVFTQGYSTPLHLLTSLPQCCAIERPPLGNGDWLVAPVGAMVKVAPNHGYISSAYISDELTAVIHRILAKNPDGTPLRSFLPSYKESTGKELEMKELGFHTLVQLLERVAGVKVMKPPDAGFMMVYGPKEKRKKRKEEGGAAGAMGSSDGCVSSESEEPPRPPGSMASAYTKQAVPSNKMVGVYVTHVHTPSCLCVQLIGENTTRTLEYLLEDLTQFYNTSRGDAYVLKKPRIGQPCCTLFNNDGYWYRAEVVSLPSSDISEVLYVDYGNTGRVPTTSLRKPKPHYMTLPAQAVRCRLAHLKPAGSTWSKQAAQLLFQMTKDKPIVAVISSVVDGLISASLCDTTTEEDIHINDTLVSQGLAIYVKDTPEEESKYDGYQPEPTPVGATGDHVPSVRIPSHNRGPSRASCTPTATPSPSPHLPTLSPSPNVPTPSSILPTPPPTPAPPGLPALATPHNSAQLMQNYLLSQQLLLQQAFLSGMTGGQPPHVNPFPGQTSQSGSLFTPIPCTPGQTGTRNTTSQTTNSSTPQPPQTSLPSVSNPVHPVSVPSSTSSFSAPPNASSSSPRESTRVEEGRGEEGGRREEGGRGDERGRTQVGVKRDPPRSLLWVKKSQLTDEHSLHILRHNDRAYVLSQQVSEWFWDTDLLQSMLRQVQKPVWGLLLQDDRAVELFRAMKNIPQLRMLLSGRREVTVYALEDIPSIVSKFHAPEPLCAALKRESQLWLQETLDYFSDSSRELEKIAADLKDLQVQRRKVLSLLAEEEEGEEDGDIQSGAQQLVDVTKAISKLKAVRARLLQQVASHKTDDEGRRGEATTSLRPVSTSSSVVPPSIGSEFDDSASQISEFDDTFYSVSPTPSPMLEPASSATFASSNIFPGCTSPTCTMVPLSTFPSSPSSISSSLSDISSLFPTSTLLSQDTEGAAVTEVDCLHTHCPSPAAATSVASTGREMVEQGEGSRSVTAAWYHDRTLSTKQGGPVLPAEQNLSSKGQDRVVGLLQEQYVSGQSVTGSECSLGRSATGRRSSSSGQSSVGIRSSTSGQGAGMRSFLGQNATAMRSSGQSFAGVNGSSSGQNGLTFRLDRTGPLCSTGTTAGSRQGHSTARAVSSSQCKSQREQTNWPASSGQSNTWASDSGRGSDRSANSGQPRNSATNAGQSQSSFYPSMNKPNLPRIRHGSKKYRPSSYGTRPSLLGSNNNRTASSGQHSNRRPASGQSTSTRTAPSSSIPDKNTDFNYSSPSSSGFSSPSETIPNSHTSTDVTRHTSTRHTSTRHTSSGSVGAAARLSTSKGRFCAPKRVNLEMQFPGEDWDEGSSDGGGRVSSGGSDKVGSDGVERGEGVSDKVVGDGVERGEGGSDKVVDDGVEKGEGGSDKVVERGEGGSDKVVGDGVERGEGGSDVVGANMEWSDAESKVTEEAKTEVEEVKEHCEPDIASLENRETLREESVKRCDKEVEAEALNEVPGGEVTGKEVTGKEVTGGEVTGGEVNGGEVNGGEVKVASGEVTSGEVTGGEVKVASGEVTGGEVTGGEVKVASGEVTGGEENSGQVASGEVMGEEVMGGEVNGGKMTGEEVVGREALSGIEEWCREMEMKGCEKKMHNTAELTLKSGGGEGEGVCEGGTQSKAGERAQLILVDLDCGDEDSAAQSKAGEREETTLVELDSGEEEGTAQSKAEEREGRTPVDGGEEEGSAQSKAGEREERTLVDGGEEEGSAQSKAGEREETMPVELDSEKGGGTVQSETAERVGGGEEEGAAQSKAGEKAKDVAVSSMKERKNVFPVASTTPCPPLHTSPLPSFSRKPVIPSTAQQYPRQAFYRPQRLVGWKNSRSIGLGRGNPMDNPRAFMFPDYPAYHPFPGQLQSFSKTPFVPYYPAGWQFMPPHPR